MAVRLNKALKELNVGINAVAEYLQKKGHALEDASPNAKITDEQFALLMREFGADKYAHVETQDDISKRLEREQKEKEERKQADIDLREKEVQQKQQFKIVGNINDIKTKNEEQSLSDRLEQDENGIYHFAAPEGAEVQFKQVGFIDLSTLNSKTRPERKSKSIRKMERMANQQVGDDRNATTVPIGGSKKKRNRIKNERVDINAAASQQSNNSKSSLEDSGIKCGNSILLDNGIELNYQYTTVVSDGITKWLRLKLNNCTINEEFPLFFIIRNDLFDAKEKRIRDGFFSFSPITNYEKMDKFISVGTKYKVKIFNFNVTPSGPSYILNVLIFINRVNIENDNTSMFFYDESFHKIENMNYEEITEQKNNKSNDLLSLPVNKETDNDNLDNFPLESPLEIKAENNFEDNLDMDIDRMKLMGNNEQQEVKNVENNITEPTIRNLSFQNFRKFKDEFEELKFGKINIFVGKNNSGKSTTVKGLQLIVNFLKNGMWNNGMFPSFDFGGNLNVGSFERALNVNADENLIKFSIGINNFDIEIFVTGQMQASIGKVTKIIVSYKKDEYIFTFDFNDTFALVINDKPEDEQLEELNNLIKEKEKIEDSLKKAKINRARILKDKLKYTESLIEAYSPKHCEFIGITPHKTKELKASSLIESLMKIFCADALSQMKSADRKSIENKRVTILQMAEELSDAISSINIERVYAHSANQTSVYNINDRNDFIAQCLHDFNAACIDKEDGGDAYYQFMKKWMDADHFEIGDDYQLQSLENEAYTLKITDKDSSKDINLGDKGKGTIQLMTLLMRLVTIAKQSRNIENRSIVLIEEPEQNLHPKLQSLLADLFYELSAFGLMFIIETHSEYLIRNTQVIVANEIKQNKFNLEINPFSVTYFCSNGNIRPMIFTEGGDFKNKFDDGFFNETTKLIRKIL